MSMYLDVTSYMLTVLTFSVGFLSARRHAHFDVLTKDLADRSWKIRQALNAGQNLGPRDLVEDIAAVEVLPDSVTKFTRVVNTFLFVSALLVFVLGLSTVGFEGDHSVTLLTILFLSTTLVFALGEFDVRWMEARERILASGTILGQLAKIDQALRSGDGIAAQDEIESIRENYPQWAFGREIEMALAATVAWPTSADSAPDPMDLARAEVALYAAPLLVAEGQLQRHDPVGALQDFNIVVPRSTASQTFDRLQLVLGLAVGLPRTVFVDPELPPRWMGGQAGLELNLRSLPAVCRASEALQEFGSGYSLKEWMARHEGSPAWLVARAATVDDDVFAKTLEAVTDPLFRGALNSLGIVCLARGRDADALRIFEIAIRVRPDSSTSHWGRAVACERRGWYVVADESLRRAESLDPPSARVLSMTRVAFRGEDLSIRIDEPGQPRWSAWEAIQLAILGKLPTNVQASPGARGELVDAVLASTLSNAEVIG